MKISNLIEQIFSHAVALDQQGTLRNTIYAINNEIFVMSFDHTVFLRFRLRESETKFDHPISFAANDYDSNIFEEVDGKIVFISGNESYQRKKIVGTTDMTPEQVRELFKKYIVKKEERVSIELNQSVLSLLDDNLSHVEFSGKKGDTITILQRNIYSGGIIEIKPKNSGMFQNTLSYDFGPVALKTNDFKALFLFQDNLTFEFSPGKNGDFILVKNLNTNKRDMKGVLACCMYDELISVKNKES